MWRLTKPWRKAEGGWRKRSRQTAEQRESVSGARLVCQSPSIHPNHAALQTNTGTHSHHTHKHTHTHYITAMSPHFETLKMQLSKGSMPDSLLQPSRRKRRTDSLTVRRGAAITKGIKSLTEWQTYMIRSGSRHLHFWANTGVRLLRPESCSFALFFRGTAQGEGSKSTWVCE